MDDIEIEVAPITWASCEAACEAVGLRPDDVLSGAEVPVVTPATAEALLEAVLHGDAPDALPDEQAAQVAGQAFFGAVQRHVAASGERVQRHAERCGVWGVMQQQAGGGPSMARALASLPPGDYQQMRTIKLEDMLTYVGLRAVSEVSDNLDDYLV